VPVPDPVTAEGGVHVRPAGAESVKVTTPEKPFREATVTVVGQLVLSVQGTVVGLEGERVKSGPVTVTGIVRSWNRPPLLANMSTVYVPGIVELTLKVAV
jgi:hypothetical protein